LYTKLALFHASTTNIAVGSDSFSDDFDAFSMKNLVEFKMV
jgi:hypothetical protein